MNIEVGDLFCVVRGFQLHEIPSFFNFFAVPGDEWKARDTPKEPRYDRSFEGLVFRALEVCHPMVCAEVAFVSDSWKSAKAGHRLSINLTELQVMTVTQTYLEHLVRPGGAP